MDHCSILPGRGPDDFDVLKALEDWVEKGIAPEQMIANQLNKEGKIMRSRPCAFYPKVVKYKGSGTRMMLPASLARTLSIIDNCQLKPKNKPAKFPLF